MVPALVPVAWVGRVSDEEQQDPVGSLLRQLRVARAKLPEGCQIMAYFYDVESGRKDLDARGLGRIMLCLRCPTRWYDPVISAAVTGVSRPVDLAEDDELRRQLEAGPDLLSAEHAAYCMQAGIQAVVRPNARALDRAEWTWLAELLEPDPRRRPPGGQGQS